MFKFLSCSQDPELHEGIQSYLDFLYSKYNQEISSTLVHNENEMYGELYYYSILKLIDYLGVNSNDHFLDIGSGLGKMIFQIFLTTKVRTVTGIEINQERHSIACKIKAEIQKQFPEIFNSRELLLEFGNFLESSVSGVTIAYVCSTVFSFELLLDLAKKINTIPSIRIVVSTRKLPGLISFKINKVIFLQATWDEVPCYIYLKS